MKAIEHFEVPQLGLLKSAVSRVLARDLKLEDTNATAIDTDHPLMRGTDIYCHAMAANQLVPEPDSDRGDDPAVQAYLASLHHRIVHAHIAGDEKLEAEITRQTQRFKYGNPLWQQMYVEYYDYYWQYPYHKGRPPHYRSWQDSSGGNGDLNYGVINWKLPADARIAIVGDIGTGTDVAAGVLLAALSFKPHAILHLGDIYFSGTKAETRHRFIGLIQTVLKSCGVRVPVFTVPGNHEYFTGNVSYFAALDSNDLVGGPSQRQSASYFCLRSQDDGWQFLGLDTGFYGHYMNVAASAQQATLDRLHIGKVETAGSSAGPYWPGNYNPHFRHAKGANLPQKDPTVPVDQVTVRTDECAWHTDKLQKFSGRSILLSHHQLYSALNACGVVQKQVTGADGKAVADPTDFNRAWVDTGLWRQFGSAFGTHVAGWIWGHEHNLGIFQSGYRPADWPQDSPDAQQIFKTLPKGRCAGHSAIPVQQSEAPYAQKFSVALERPDLMLGLTNGWYNRGFQIFEADGAGHPAQLRYYQTAEADPTPLLIFEESIE